MTENREWLTGHLVEQAALVLRLSQAAASRPDDTSLLLSVRDEVFTLRETLDTLEVPLARSSNLEWSSSLEWNKVIGPDGGPAA